MAYSPFLLGPWLESAKRWATSQEDRRLYEWNARNLITLWGPADSTLHEYAARQWSGLFSGFYQKRWELFTQRLREGLHSKQPLDPRQLEEESKSWEEGWTHQDEAYPTTPRGDPVIIVRRMLERWPTQSTASY